MSVFSNKFAPQPSIEFELVSFERGFSIALIHINHELMVYKSTKDRTFCINSFKGYKSNTDDIRLSFYRFHFAHNISQIVITDVFDHDESIVIDDHIVNLEYLNHIS